MMVKLLIKNLKNCEYFQAIDKTTICELLHPHLETENIKMGFSIAHAFLKPDKSSVCHKMMKSVEIYYIIQGKGIMHIFDEEREVFPGEAIYIPPGSNQWIENIGDVDLQFLCIVSPPWEADDEELCD